MAWDRRFRMRPIVAGEAVKRTIYIGEMPKCMSITGSSRANPNTSDSQ
jgi:hypothetical protein